MIWKPWRPPISPPSPMRCSGLLHRNGGLNAVRGEIGAVRATANPYVRRLHILIYLEAGTIIVPRVETVWIDDFELAFLLLDDFN